MEEGARLTEAMVAAVLLARPCSPRIAILARGRRVGDNAHDPLEGPRGCAASAESNEPRPRWPIGLPLVRACQDNFFAVGSGGGDTSM